MTPTVVGKQLSMNPLSVLLSVMFWGWLWGMAGAVLAVPLLILLKAISKRNRLMRPVSVYLQGSDRPSPSLAALLHPPGATVTTIDTTIDTTIHTEVVDGPGEPVRLQAMTRDAHTEIHTDLQQPRAAP